MINNQLINHNVNQNELARILINSHLLWSF